MANENPISQPMLVSRIYCSARGQHLHPCWLAGVIGVCSGWIKKFAFTFYIGQVAGLSPMEPPDVSSMCALHARRTAVVVALPKAKGKEQWRTGNKQCVLPGQPEDALRNLSWGSSFAQSTRTCVCAESQCRPTPLRSTSCSETVSAKRHHLLNKWVLRMEILMVLILSVLTQSFPRGLCKSFAQGEYFGLYLCAFK